MDFTEEFEQRVTAALDHVAGLPSGRVEAWTSSAARVSSPARQGRLRRRRVAIALVGVAVLTAGVVLAVRASRPTKVVESTAPNQPSGWTAADYGLIRLSLPPGWTSVNECTASGQSLSTTPDIFLLEPTSPQQLSCAPPIQGGWVSLRPLTGPAPAWWTRSSVNGIEDWITTDQVSKTETIDLPAEGLQLSAQGDGRQILATVGYSSLQAVLKLAKPVDVPMSWKAVRFDGLQAKVPSSWPVEVVTNRETEPAVCGLQVFYSPQVYLGDSGGVHPCPMVSVSDRGTMSSSAGQLPPAVNGLWIESRLTETTGESTQPFWTGSLTARIAYSDTDVAGSFSAQVNVINRPVSVTIGLATVPTIAEEILSSIQLSGLPNNRPQTTP